MRLDFENGQWVEVRDAKMLPWGVQRKLAEVADKDDVASKLRSAEVITIALVKSGRLLDWDGNEIAIPLNDESVQNVDGDVLVKVVEEFGKSRGNAVPKG